MRSEGHCKVAELWNMLLSVHKCFVSQLLFGDACGFLNLVSLQTCTSWSKLREYTCVKEKQTAFPVKSRSLL